MSNMNNENNTETTEVAPATPAPIGAKITRPLGQTEANYV